MGRRGGGVLNEEGQGRSVGNHPLRRMLCRCIMVISGAKTLLEIIGSNQLLVKKWAKDVD
jgi:hypothetical protein